MARWSILKLLRGLLLKGELTLFRPDEFDKPNIVNTIKNIKKTTAKKTPPAFCYPTVPEGKAGNFKLAKGCTYCRHKFECHKDSNNGKGLRGLSMLREQHTLPILNHYLK